MIELVVVIAIVGILAAVALPQFMNATKDAHQAAVKGTAGALAPAVMLARAQYEINRSGGTLGCETTSCQQNVRGFGGGLVDVNANGWPIGVSRGDNAGATAAMSVATCNEVFTNVLQGSAPSVGTTDSDYSTAVGTSNTECVFTYRNDGGNDTITYNVNTGAVSYAFN